MSGQDLANTETDECSCDLVKLSPVVPWPKDPHSSASNREGRGRGRRCTVWNQLSRLWSFIRHQVFFFFKGTEI